MDILKTAPAEVAGPEAANWLNLSDDEATTKIIDVAHNLREWSDSWSFDELKKQTTKKLGAMTSLEIFKRLKGNDHPVTSSDLEETEYQSILTDCMVTIDHAFENFRGTKKLMLEPDTDAFPDAISKASWQASVQIVDRFKKGKEPLSETTNRLLTWLDDIDEVNVAAFFEGREELRVPDTLSYMASAEEWKKFIVYVHMLPNAAWMGGIFARTIAGQDINADEPGVQFATEKKNVGTYGHMVSELRSQGEETLLQSLELDRAEVKRWIGKVDADMEKIEQSLRRS